MPRPYRECTPECHEDSIHRCTANSKQRGARCEQPAEDLCRVCRWHGSQAPQVQAKKKAKIMEIDAQAALADLTGEVAPVTDPVTALQQLAGEIVLVKNIFRERVAHLTEVETYDRQGVENVRAIVSVYERGLDRTVDVLSRLAKLGIEERAVQADEDAVRVLFLAVTATLESPSLGLTGAQVETARSMIASTLREQAAIDA